MKTKQLANILIKIVGLSVIAHGIPSVLSGFVTMIQAVGRAGNYNYASNYLWLYPLSSLVAMAVGIYLIVKSREVTALLFKDEAD
jgi:hypothetical protein